MPATYDRATASTLMSLTETERNVILGTLLGDGSLAPHPAMKSARLRVHHSSKQREYVQWKYGQLKRLVRTAPRQAANGGYGVSSFVFSTLSYPALLDAWRLCYPEGRKTVSAAWLGAISHPIALAVWYMDDGSQEKCTCRLATDGFTAEEVRLLVHWLWHRWGVRSRQDWSKGGRYPFIRMTAEGRDKFQDIVRPWLAPSMLYKTLPRMEDVYCGMCGGLFRVSRKAFRQTKKLLICGDAPCVEKYDRMYNRVLVHEQRHGAAT